MYLNFKDIVLTPQKSIVNSRSECDTSATLGKHTFKIPVVAANMKSIINPEICALFDANNWFYVYHRINGAIDVFNFAQIANQQNYNVVSISVGVGKDWLWLIDTLYANNLRIDYFTVDVAHSHNENVLPILRTIRKYYPESYVICGNGCTKEWVQWLESYQLVDCIKVGIGVSASCRTRQFTGFGSSTLGSLSECVEVTNLDVMSDGGITIEGDTICIGDVAKAIVFGADWVMSGALFSQCIDSPAVKHGYYGNASRQSKGNSHVEGTLVNVKSNGLTLVEQMSLIEESLRSSISYAGVKKVDELFNAPFEITR